MFLSSMLGMAEFIISNSGWISGYLGLRGFSRLSDQISRSHIKYKSGGFFKYRLGPKFHSHGILSFHLETPTVEVEYFKLI